MSIIDVFTIFFSTASIFIAIASIHFALRKNKYDDKRNINTIKIMLIDRASTAIAQNNESIYILKGYASGNAVINELLLNAHTNEQFLNKIVRQMILDYKNPAYRVEEIEGLFGQISEILLHISVLHSKLLSTREQGAIAFIRSYSKASANH